MRKSRFTLHMKEVEDARLLRAVGEIDLATCQRLRSQLEAAREARTTTLLDMSQVEFIDTSGLEVLLEAARASADQEWALFIVRPSARVLRLVELTRTASKLPLVDVAGACLR